MTNQDLSYIAGFVDGEGCINIVVANRKKSKTHVVTLTIGNTNKEVLTWISSVFGFGRIHLVNRSKKSNWKICYGLRWCAQQAEDVISAIYPWLKVKKRQAEIAL